jgi:hypothetical protein
VWYNVLHAEVCDPLPLSTLLFSFWYKASQMAATMPISSLDGGHGVQEVSPEVRLEMDIAKAEVPPQLDITAISLLRRSSPDWLFLLFSGPD